MTFLIDSSVTFKLKCSIAPKAIKIKQNSKYNQPLNPKDDWNETPYALPLPFPLFTTFFIVKRIATNTAN